MNDDRLDAALGSFYRDTALEPRDPEQGLAEVRDRVRRTRQRGRWWPLPSFEREVHTPTATEMTTYEPSPIPATNGRAPFVIRRTQIMFGSTKAIVAAALVFVIGGSMLIGQPFGQQPGVQPGAQSTDPTGAMADVAVGPGTTYFTGTRECSPAIEGRDLVEKVWIDQMHLTCAVVTDDQMFSGAEQVDANYYLPMPRGTKPGPWTAEGELTGEDGSWRGIGEGVFDTEGTSSGSTFHHGQMAYVGEGAYEGLVARYYFAGDEELMSLIGWITSPSE